MYPSLFQIIFLFAALLMLFLGWNKKWKLALAICVLLLVVSLFAFGSFMDNMTNKRQLLGLPSLDISIWMHLAVYTVRAGVKIIIWGAPPYVFGLLANLLYLKHRKKSR